MRNLTHDTLRTSLKTSKTPEAFEFDRSNTNFGQKPTLGRTVRCGYLSGHCDTNDTARSREIANHFATSALKNLPQSNPAPTFQPRNASTTPPETTLFNTNMLGPRKVIETLRDHSSGNLYRICGQPPLSLRQQIRQNAASNGIPPDGTPFRPLILPIVVNRVNHWREAFFLEFGLERSDR